MSSWKEGLGLLEGHLPPNPPLFQVHGYLPVALLRYDPEDAWELSRQLDLMTSRLETHGTAARPRPRLPPAGGHG